ncbi:helix-turn-helix domain-containing protein [uncultured Brevundimonas sp.]|uniref:winged helix-turn-helix transcriptional regulator n=1 Tax=uncultured Brevundimonas sp. TaxID=213418 RepID=UPI00260F6287|nr:helix-turn-helix domain-containing protein [uncultured Brevundimonas sp.]
MQHPDLRLLVMGNPVARAFAIVGDAWTQLILREAFYGVRRFNVWCERLGTPRSVLTDRLGRLVEAGIFVQTQAETGLRTEYRLTDRGLDLFGVAVMQGQWERVWAASALQERYEIAFFDRESGGRIQPVVLTEPFGKPVDPTRVTWEAGPGLKLIDPPTSRRRRSVPASSDRPIIDRSTEIIGDYWSWAVLSAAFFRVRRFDEFHSVLGVATNILADRLARLTAHGVLEKRPYQRTPLRYEYRLSRAGRDMYPIVLAMLGWSQKWLLSPRERPLILKDRDSGKALKPTVCDLETGQPMNPRATRWDVERAD